MGLIGWLLVGLIAGYLARRVTPGVRSGGVLIDCLTGVVGSVIGGVIAWLLYAFLGIPILYWFWGIPEAFVVAVILLAILKANATPRIR